MNVAVMDNVQPFDDGPASFPGLPINDESGQYRHGFSLLFLDSTDRTRDINMYINSPRRQCLFGSGVYDAMQYVSPDVATICIGMAASSLCAAGAGTRANAPRSSIPGS